MELYMVGEAGGTKIPPGRYLFSLGSTTSTLKDNSPISYDTILTINGYLYYKYENGALEPRADLAYDDETTDNQTWLIAKTQELENFYFQKNFDKIFIGTTNDINQATMTFGSGIVKSIDITNSTDPHWIQAIDYKVEIAIPGSGKPGGAKYLSNPTVSPYVSDIEYNISISKKTEYDFADELSLNPSRDQQNFLPEYNITRTIGAVGKFGQPSGGPLYYAKNYVHDLLYHHNYYDSIFTNITKNLYVSDRSVVIEADEIAGLYKLTENLTAYSGNTSSINNPKQYVNTYDVNIAYTQELKRTVRINGIMKSTKFTYVPQNIPKLDPPEESRKYLFDNLSAYHATTHINRFDDLKDKFNTEIKNFLYSKAISYVYNKGLGENFFLDTTYKGEKIYLERGGNTLMKNFSGTVNGSDIGHKEWLNPKPSEFKVTFNPQDETIEYDVVYDNSPLPLVIGAINEEITSQDNYGQNLYAQHDAYFRKNTMLQDLNTYSINSRTVTYSANLPRIYWVGFDLNVSTRKQISGVIDAFNPAYIYTNNLSGPPYARYLVEDTSSIDPYTGKYQMTKKWEW